MTDHPEALVLVTTNIVLRLSLARFGGRTLEPHHQPTLAANVSRSSLTTIMMRGT